MTTWIVVFIFFILLVSLSFAGDRDQDIADYGDGLLSGAQGNVFLESGKAVIVRMSEQDWNSIISSTDSTIADLTKVEPASFFEKLGFASAVQQSGADLGTTAKLEGLLPKNVADEVNKLLKVRQVAQKALAIEKDPQNTIIGGENVNWHTVVVLSDGSGKNEIVDMLKDSTNLKHLDSEDFTDIAIGLKLDPNQAYNKVGDELITYDENGQDVNRGNFNIGYGDSSKRKSSPSLKESIRELAKTDPSKLVIMDPNNGKPFAPDQILLKDSVEILEAYYDNSVKTSDFDKSKIASAILNKAAGGIGCS